MAMQRRLAAADSNLRQVLDLVRFMKTTYLSYIWQTYWVWQLIVRVHCDTNTVQREVNVASMLSWRTPSDIFLTLRPSIGVEGTCSAKSNH